MEKVNLSPEMSPICYETMKEVCDVFIQTSMYSRSTQREKTLLFEAFGALCLFHVSPAPITPDSDVKYRLAVGVEENHPALEGIFQKIEECLSCLLYPRGEYGMPVFEFMRIYYKDDYFVCDNGYDARLYYVI